MHHSAYLLRLSNVKFITFKALIYSNLLHNYYFRFWHACDTTIPFSSAFLSLLAVELLLSSNCFYFFFIFIYVFSFRQYFLFCLLVGRRISYLANISNLIKYIETSPKIQCINPHFHISTLKTYTQMNISTMAFPLECWHAFGLCFQLCLDEMKNKQHRLLRGYEWV